MHKPTSNFLKGFYAGGFFPIVSLPTRLTDTTATFIDNIWTNNLEREVNSGLVTVRVSDHLPIYAFMGGNSKESGGQANNSMCRLVNEVRITRFAGNLEAWTFNETRSLGIEAQWLILEMSLEISMILPFHG